MAEKNLSPRQKMIGMMYLVLTAMLALNVQREILDAFVVIEEGTHSSLESLQLRNEALYSEFKFANGLDPMKTGPYYEGANRIRQHADAVSVAIDSLKSRVIAETEGLEPAVADTISMGILEKLDRYDDATRILAGSKEDASDGRARSIKEDILRFAEQVNGSLRELGLEALDMPFDFSDHNDDGKMVNWEIHTFYEIPLAACVAILTKMQSDVRTVEYNAVSQLLASVDVDDIPVDTVLARVVPASRYVMLGEQYESEIFLSAYNSTTSPEMIIDGPGELQVSDGVGIMRFKPTQAGEYSYTGNIVIRDKKGNPRSYPFESSYTVVRPMATVSPTAMNVLYVGPDNPLSVSVPGVPDEKLRVSITGGNELRKVGPGEYIAKMRLDSPRNVQVVVKAESDEGLKDMGVMDFRVKKLPQPYVRFGDITNNGTMDHFDLINNSLHAEYEPDFVFPLPLNIVDFKLIVVRGNGDNAERMVQGRKVGSSNEALINSLRPSDRVIFSNIRVKDASGRILPTNDIMVTVKR